MTSRWNRSGFTIIEVTLFLAISGLVLVGVLTAFSGTISRQRYNDASTSFRDYLQGQVSTVQNVRSNRPDTSTCTSGGFGTSLGGVQPRGTSDCTVIGRLVQSDAAARVITSQPIYATNDVTDTSVTNATSVTASLLALNLSTTDEASEADEYRLSWQTRVTSTSAPTAAYPFTLAIIRVPYNDTIRIYGLGGVESTVNDVINGSTPLELCVDPQGLVNPAIAEGVQIKSGAGNSSGIQFLGEGACA